MASLAPASAPHSDLGGSTRYAVVVPEHLRGAVERVPLRERVKPGIENFSVTQSGQVQL